MGITKKLASMSALALTAAATLVTVGSGQAMAAPNFQMPFKCGYTATAATFSGHNPTNSVDFQKSGITGDTVVASAAGTVSIVGDEGGTSYGKWIEVDHGGGWTTRYAHLSAQSVSQGQSVNAGTKLGEAGNTGGTTGPHLHFEQNLNGSAQKVVLDGTQVPYFGKTEVTSNNCGGGGGNPHTPEKICGDGFGVINKHKLGDAGNIFLLYNNGTGENCVTTVKSGALDKKTAASATLQVEGGQAVEDTGKFQYYAGPVKQKAAGSCVKWGGSLGSKSFTSEFEHCG